MTTSARANRILAIMLTIGLLVAIIVPFVTRAGQQSMALSPGDKLIVTCETSLNGTMQGVNQATVDCAEPAPQAEAQPVVLVEEQAVVQPEAQAAAPEAQVDAEAQARAAPPQIREIRGVQNGGSISGKANIEAIISGSGIDQVVFEVTGPHTGKYIERTAPYFLNGDTNGVPNGIDTTLVPDGNYTMVVTAINRSGQKSSVTITFAIANRTPNPNPNPTAVPTAVPPAAPTAVPTAVPTAAPNPGGETPVAGQICPAWVHDRYVTTGPDGKSYPTWHPAVDPEFGCVFGHEHGADPRRSKADNTLPAFGYAGKMAGFDEPHEGFKVFILNAGDIADDGRRISADYRIVFHMGTARVGRYTTQMHSMEYDYIARDGTGREAHVTGMSDTGTQQGSTCDSPRKAGRDFSTIGCGDPYEIWTFKFSIIHPADPYTDAQHVRAYLSGSVAAFDPITTRDPSDNTRLVFTQEYRHPGSGIDPTSPNAAFQGCNREAYGGPNFWSNAGQPTSYYTDPYGRVMDGPGAGRILQQISASKSNTNEIYKYPESFCGNGIRFPN